MRLDLCQAETAQITRENSVLLDEARQRIIKGENLTGLEKNDVLHALQVLIENAIGKSKQILKSKREPVPISAYDSFATLVRLNVIKDSELTDWNAIIGVRNRIAHEYMSVDMALILELIKTNHYGFIVEFLMKSIAVKV